ncbi:hypothetical protein QTP88_029311 [Uroleucon formosanum]
MEMENENKEPGIIILVPDSNSTMAIKYINSDHHISGIETPLFANIELNDDCVYADLFKIPTAEITTTTTENINLTYNSTRSVDVNIDVFSNDPAKLTLLAPFSYEKRKLILNNGPCQPQKIDMPNKRFPVHNSRSFQCSWYMKTMPDGSTTRREWLSYSCGKDKIFCIYCILIGNEKSMVWTSTGFSSWNKASERIVMHETSSNHIEVCLKIKLEDTCLPLLPSMLKARNEFVATNRMIVEAIIEIILYLARHSLAFRGHRESWSDNLRGNFKDLVCLLGKYHPILATYIVGHQEKNKNKYDFISWRRQNQILESLASYTRVVVLKQIKTAKFFSLTMDGTFDNSRKEQLAFVIRYLIEDSGEINGRLINLKECNNTSSEQLFNIFEKICNENSLNWKDYLVGQSYDGASNMRGAYNGLQAIIRRSNTAAIFVWCYAHRLNLVLIDAVSSSVNAVDMFGIIETVHDFINSSKKRVALFELHQEKCYGNKQRKRRFKRVQTTRWWSHDLALNTVLDTFDALCDTLEELQKSECVSDRKGAHQAKCLKENLICDKFLLTAFIYKQLFEIVTPLSKMLQTVDIDLIGVIAVVDDKTRELKNARSDVHFLKLQEKVNLFKMSTSMDIEDFKPLPLNRSKRVPKRSAVETQDEVITDPLQNFKIQTFFVAYDTAIVQIKERFSEIAKGIYKDLSLFSRRRLEEISKNNDLLPKDAFDVFCDVYSKFIQKDVLKREYLQFSKSYFNFEQVKLLPLQLHKSKIEIDDDLSSSLTDEASESETEDSFENNDNKQVKEVPKLHKNGCSLSIVLKVLLISGLSSTFPMLTTALKIAVTLPVASTTPERTFSKLNIVKNKLRSTMAEGRLESLMILSCESDIKIETDQIINDFARKSVLLEKALLY